jgi:hypothetical protein
MIPYSVFSKFDSTPSEYSISDMPIFTNDSSVRMAATSATFDGNNYVWMADKKKIVRKFEYTLDEVAVEIPQYPDILGVASGPQGSLYTISTTDNLHLMVAKISRGGGIDWIKDVNVQDPDNLQDSWLGGSPRNKPIASDSAGNIYILVSSINYSFYGTRFPLVIKMTSTGEVVWCKAIILSGSFGEIGSFSITIGESGNPVIAIASGYPENVREFGVTITYQRNTIVLIYMLSNGTISSSVQHDIPGYTYFEIDDLSANSLNDVAVSLFDPTNVNGTRLIRYAGGAFSWIRRPRTSSSAIEHYSSIAIDELGNTYTATGVNGTYGIIKINSSGSLSLTANLSTSNGSGAPVVFVTDSGMGLLDNKYILSLEGDSAVYGRSWSFKDIPMSVSLDGNFTIDTVSASLNTRYSISTNELPTIITNVDTYQSFKLSVSSSRKYL